MIYSQKTRHNTRIDNFDTSIFKILSLLDSAQNLRQNDHYVSQNFENRLIFREASDTSRVSCFFIHSVVDWTCRAPGWHGKTARGD